MHEFPSAYLLDMPARVLFGTCRGIEAWCHNEDKMVPKLLDVALAREARAAKRPR